jgi:hypothetical protein
VSTEARTPFPPRIVTKAGIDTAVGAAWNLDGAQRGLLPLAWHLGDLDTAHFVGNANAYAPRLRRDIVEAWIADLGLVDDIIGLIHGPLQRAGSTLIWNGAVDGVSFQFSYPAGPDDLNDI